MFDCNIRLSILYSLFLFFLLVCQINAFKDEREIANRFVDLLADLATLDNV